MASLSEGDRSLVGLRLVFVLCCLQSLLCISIDISFSLNSLYLFLTRFGILWQRIARDRVRFRFSSLRAIILTLNEFHGEYAFIPPRANKNR